MTKQQEERFVGALESIGQALDAIGRIMEKRLDLEFPPQKETVDAEIFRQGEQQGQEEAITPSVGRFEKQWSEVQK